MKKRKISDNYNEKKGRTPVREVLPFFFFITFYWIAAT